MMNAPLSDDNQPMRDSLQRDAARVSEPPFDAALHHDTMRRLRVLATPNSKSFWFIPVLATATAVVALAFIAFWPEHASRPPQTPPMATIEPAVATGRASFLAYEEAARDGDASLFAVLDRDAATLLPPSAPIFNSALQ